MPDSSSDAKPLSTYVNSDLTDLDQQYLAELKPVDGNEPYLTIHDETLDEENIATIGLSSSEAALLEKLQEYEEKINRNMLDNDDEDKYGCFITGDDNFVIYDRDNPEAWIQSDFSVEVG
ncbi:DUF7331 family protein [Candidatus Nanohalobium constans]|uniref:Uncharacterized protein n=1 Tax=Candidatus Nanohalobium constans TaxID=2565781 RepID=A0A5Q0UHS6_9ARCH|nr:hypothetical protein [Candidatus Nanohalobium constans]QGA80485.1 hypothetical protein LC1Nh_0590 [Candidatus Nanohalobium constans]